MLNMVDSLSFDDVLLIPKYSEIMSRSNVDLSVELSKGIKLSHCIVPANMKSITEWDMAKAIYDTGGMALIHRFMPFEEQLNITNQVKQLKNGFNHIGFSVGVKKEDYDYVDTFVARGVNILCIDIAHGDSKVCVEMVKYIANKYPNVFLIAGTVATGDGAKRLWKNGADAVRVNVGAGSICSTRIMTGNGVPLLSSLSDVWDTKIKYEKELNKKIFVISDGGCSKNGDFVKALCFSDVVMTGHFFRGTDEAAGETIEVNGTKMKSYDGSSTHRTNHIEGVKTAAELKGKVRNLLPNLFDSIKSGLSYQGCKNLSELKIDPRFARITSAGLRESHPHDVFIIGG